MLLFRVADRKKDECETEDPPPDPIAATDWNTQTLKLLKYFPLHVVKSVGFNLGQFGACDVSLLLLLKLNSLFDTTRRMHNIEHNLSEQDVRFLKG